MEGRLEQVCVILGERCRGSFDQDCDKWDLDRGFEILGSFFFNYFYQ